MVEVVVSGDNWSCKSCKAPVKSSPPTNQQPTITDDTKTINVWQHYVHHTLLSNTHKGKEIFEADNLHLCTKLLGMQN